MRGRPVKVPVVMQSDSRESGAACLSMLLAYFGCFIPLERLRSDCSVGRASPGPENLLRVAAGYGLTGEAGSFPASRPEELPVPCMVLKKDGSYGVVRGFSGHLVFLNDPAEGTLIISAEQFLEAYTEKYLRFTPGADFKKGGKYSTIPGFARARLHGSFFLFLFVALTGLAAAVTGVAAPAFSRVFLDRILTGRNPEWLIPFLLLLSLLTVAGILCSALGAVYMLKIRGKLAVVGNASFMWRLLRLPMPFFSQYLPGDLALRQSFNDEVADTLIGQLVPVALHVVMLVLYLTVMLRYSPLLTAIGLSSTALNLLCVRFVAKHRVNITRAQLRDDGKLQNCTISGMEMIETIKAMGAENGYFARWAGYEAAVSVAVARLFKLKKYISAAPLLLQSLTGVAILIAGARLILDGSFTTGMLLAFQGFLAAFLAPVSSLITMGQLMEEMRARMERIDDVMNAEEEKQPAMQSEDSLEKLSGAVVMEDVSFGYSKLEPPFIEHFNLTLTPGKSVAIVGASGCGKSTVSRLLSGLYTPWSGRILYDGKPREQIGRVVFTGSLAVVDQDIVLFEDTIANNLRMWDTSIEEFELIMAARDAHIHEDIMCRDGGYDAPVLAGGSNFSGGQRQRLEIARVLAQDPTLLIMDEATSALDAGTEAAVVSSIRDRGITCIVIAHRLSTIRDCDEIIVLDRGRVVERGRHEELFAMGGWYTGLISNE